MPKAVSMQGGSVLVREEKKKNIKDSPRLRLKEVGVRSSPGGGSGEPPTSYTHLGTLKV
jgi:hypothetical protein